jgi:hypothetical protein
MSTTYGGVYEAQVVNDNGDNLRLVVPQIFGDTQITCSRWLGSTRPTTSDRGYVSFIGGDAAWPVWMVVATGGGTITNVSEAGAPEVWVGDDEPSAEDYVLWYDSDAEGQAAEDLISADAGNDLVTGSDGGLYFDHDNPNKVLFRGELTTQYQVWTDAMWFKVPLDSLPVNIGNGWDPANSHWVAPRAGVLEVIVSATTTLGQSAIANVILSIWQGAVEYRFAQINGASINTFAGSGTRWLNVTAGQPISLQVYMNCLNVAKYVYPASFTFMAIRYIS